MLKFSSAAATAAAVAALLSSPAYAQAIDTSQFAGDPAAGEEAFNRQCAACHVVVNDAGETLAGRNARTGPNQYNLAYNLIGHQEDFDYSDSIMELNEAGERWNEEKFVGYVQDPTGWLREATDDPRARGKMAYRVRDEQDARDLWAYFTTVTPELTDEAAVTAYEEDVAATN